MNKISLVARRQDRQFGIPTSASERAMHRMEEELSSGTQGTRAIPDSISLSMVDGGPALDLRLPNEQAEPLANIVSGYLDGADTAEVVTEISLERKEAYTGIKFQFEPSKPVKMLNSRQLAAMLGISVSTVYSLHRKGRIRGYKAGRSWRFQWHEVLEDIESH